MRKKVLATKTSVQGGRTVILIFLFFFAIMLCAPKSYDDFEFADVAKGSFQEMVEFALTYGNGRVLGNIGGVVLQVSRPVAAFVKAATMTGLVYVIPGVLGIHSGTGLAVSFLLVAGVEPSLFAQVFTWTSGFQNYAPPVVLSLLALYLMQQYPTEKGWAGKKAAIVLGVSVLGVICQLYAEHSLIVHLLLAALVLAKVVTDRAHRALVPAVVFCLAVLAGTGAHLWVPRAFVEGASHTDGYRSVYLYDLKDTLFCCARNFLRLCNQYCGLLGLPLCAGAWFAGNRTAHRRSETANLWQKGMCIIPAGYMLLTRLTHTNGWFGETAVVQEALEAAMVMLPLLSWLWALISEEDTLHRNRQLTLLGFALLALAPLLIVHPIGYRVQLHSYIFLVLACLQGGREQIALWKPQTRRVVTQALGGACLLLSLCLGFSFFTIYTMDTARNAHILQEMENGAEEIFIFRFPFDYVHDDRDPLLGSFFYHETPQDIQFPVLTFDIWQDQYVK